MRARYCKKKNTYTTEQCRCNCSEIWKQGVGSLVGQTSVILNQNDIIFWQIANLLDDDDCTLEVDSTWSVKER